MDPENPDPEQLPQFPQLLEQHDIRPTGDTVRAWAAIIRGIALNTRDGSTLIAHNSSCPVGKALRSGNLTYTEQPLWDEADLDLILSITGPPLRERLSRVFTFTADRQITFDWEEMASFILADAQSDRRSEPHRLNIARAYISA